MSRKRPDVQVENHGSIFLIRPLNQASLDWIADNVSDDGELRWFGSALAVEPRYAWDIAQGMRADGLRVI